MISCGKQINLFFAAVAATVAIAITRPLPITTAMAVRPEFNRWLVDASQELLDASRTAGNSQDRLEGHTVRALIQKPLRSGQGP
jgi:hypothetical protein